MTLLDAHEQDENPRRILREIIPSTKFPNIMELICSIIDFVISSIQGETN
jgi:hypothetical protein